MITAYEKVGLGRTIEKVAVSGDGTVTGAGIDLYGAGKKFQNALAVVTVGTWTDGAHTFTLQGAPDGGAGAAGTYVALAAGAGLEGTNAILVDADTEDAVTHYIGFNTIEDATPVRFLRVICVSTGVTIGVDAITADIVLTDPVVLPVR